MKVIWNDFKIIATDKKYIISIILTGIFAYITMILQPCIGIDDTAIDMYFEQGVATVAGRWVLYLINKVFGFISYNPYLIELLVVAVFCVSMLIWCVLFKRLFRNMLSDAVIIVSACVFLSSPIFSEIWVWYLQNGIALAFGLTALAILSFWDMLEQELCMVARLKRLGLCCGFLVLAVGCYESFMFVFVMACMLCFAVKRIIDGKKHKEVRRYLCAGVVVCGISMILRAIIVNVLTWVFGLQSQIGILRTRSLGEALVWFNGEKSISELVEVWKQFFVSYYVNAVVYLPITLFVLAEVMIVVWAFVWSIKKKDVWVALAVLAMCMLPWLLPVIEGIVTPYRSAQYIPMICAFGVLVLGYCFRCLGTKKWIRILGTVAAVFILYHQIFEMNKWFYVDYLKYEDAIRFTDQLALDLERNFDTNKPIMITGSHEVPYSIVKEGYVPYWSKKYIIASTVIEMIDSDLLELYNTEYGYAYVQTPFLSVIDWGITAFHHTDVQLIRFMQMQGHDLTADEHYEHYVEAWKVNEDMPRWPQEGAIIDMGDYIWVNL